MYMTWLKAPFPLNYTSHFPYLKGLPSFLLNAKLSFVPGKMSKAFLKTVCNKKLFCSQGPTFFDRKNLNQFDHRKKFCE